MGQDRAGITDRIDVLDRAGDPDLMPHELAQTVLEAAVADQERRGDDIVAGGPHGNADRIIVGEFVGESGKAANSFEHGAPHCYCGAEAWLRQP